jgi:hypothetical protein
VSNYVIPPEFLALPAHVRERIVLEAQQIGDRVVSHAVPILIGPTVSKQSGSKVSHASGVQVLVEATRYLATAAHVIREVSDRTQAGEDFITQVGNAAVPVLDRVAFFDEVIDLAFMVLTKEESDAISSICWIPEAWPPTSPAEGEFVAFAGFPRRYREDNGPGLILLGAIGGILRVESVSDRRLTSVLNRDDLVLTKGHEIAPRGSEIGGLSGGPVFRIVNGKIELAAVFKEDSVLYDAYFFAPMASVTLDPDVRVKV